MKCPHCGAASDVLSTRPSTATYTKRRRECFNGHRFTTHEVYAVQPLSVLVAKYEADPEKVVLLEKARRALATASATPQVLQPQAGSAEAHPHASK